MTTEIIETPKKPAPKPLKAWKVIVHNDDINTYEHVIISLMQIVKLEPNVALMKTVEVDTEGLSIVAITHKEHAELLQEQLQSKTLTVTIESA
jgi:ATP-dependent Clp protease adapter protein ClpS